VWVDVSGLEVPGLECLPMREGCVELGVLAGFLSRVDVAGLASDFDVLELVAVWERLVGAARAAQLVAVAELAARPEVPGPDDDAGVAAARAVRAPAGTTTRGWLGEELAARLGDSPWGGGRLARVGMQAPVRFPELFAAHRAGLLSATKIRLVVDGCARLEDDQARQVDARLAGRAARLAPSRLRHAVSRAVLREDPTTAADRRQRAERDRCVRINPTSEGMAELWALLPAAAATALGQALDDSARTLKAAGDDRTLDQLRADALTAQLTTKVEIGVLVPASALLGLSEDPATLGGHGPIDADLARALAADGTWRRILTDPEGAALAAADASVYRPGTILARHIATRDQTCRYPGCDRPAPRCDLDHTTPHPFGPTSAGNLGALCRRHHLLKHAEGGSGACPPRLQQPAPGHFTWTMPTGHQYATGPPPLHEPDDPLGVATTPCRPVPHLEFRRAAVLLGHFPHADRRSA
jgi:hypothetical protein